MQIILSDREILVIHNALLEEKQATEQALIGRGDTKRAEFMQKDIRELEALIKRFKPYVDGIGT